MWIWRTMLPRLCLLTVVTIRISGGWGCTPYEISLSSDGVQHVAACHRPPTPGLQGMPRKRRPQQREDISYLPRSHPDWCNVSYSAVFAHQQTCSICNNSTSVLAKDSVEHSCLIRASKDAATITVVPPPHGAASSYDDCRCTVTYRPFTVGCIGPMSITLCQHLLYLRQTQ